MQLHTEGAAVLSQHVTDGERERVRCGRPRWTDESGTGKKGRIRRYFLPWNYYIHTLKPPAQLPGQIPQIISDNYCLPYRFSSGEIEIST